MVSAVPLYSFSFSFAFAAASENIACTRSRCCFMSCYRAQNRAVLARRLVLGLDEFAVEINIDVGALDYIVHVLAEHVVLPRLGDDAVEVVVRGEEGVHVARVVGGVAVAHEAVEPFERALVHAGAAGELDAHILKILADGIGIVHLVRGRRSDARPAVRDDLHKPFVREPAQRLAHGRAADSHFVRYFNLEEPLRGLQLAAQDFSAQLHVHGIRRGVIHPMQHY